MTKTFIDILLVTFSENKICTDFRFQQSLENYTSYILIGVELQGQGSLSQDSITNDLYFQTRDFSSIFLRIV